jgi:ABC-type phosphonate transport system ATPase subunit
MQAMLLLSQRTNLACGLLLEKGRQKYGTTNRQADGWLEKKEITLQSETDERKRNVW